VGLVKRQGLIDLLRIEKLDLALMPMYANFLGVHIKPENGKATIGDIIDNLRALRDPETNANMVTRVLAREDLFKGPFANEAPDLVVQFSYNYRLGFDPWHNRLITDSRNPVKSGEHRMEGLFIASGPRIKTGELQQEWSIPDVTPTLLYLLDTPIPKNYDGRVINELFSNGYFRKNAPCYKDMTDMADANSQPPVNPEEDEFEKSKALLEGLGYL